MKPRQKKKGFEENQDTSSFDDTIYTNIVKKKRDAKKSKVIMKVLGEIQNENIAKIKLHMNEISSVLILPFSYFVDK